MNFKPTLSILVVATMSFPSQTAGEYEKGRSGMDRAFVAHGTDVVPFGIEEAHQFADRRNL